MNQEADSRRDILRIRKSHIDRANHAGCGSRSCLRDGLGVLAHFRVGRTFGVDRSLEVSAGGVVVPDSVVRGGVARCRGGAGWMLDCFCELAAGRSGERGIGKTVRELGRVAICKKGSSNEGEACRTVRPVCRRGEGAPSDEHRREGDDQGV